VEPIVSGVGTLDKGVRLLELVEAHGPRSLAELVTGSGLSRATTHRLAVALEAHGLLRRAPDGRFALGLRLVGLGRAAADALPLAEAAGPALAALREATGESAQLYVREGDRRVCVASLESPHGLRTIVAMGAALPLDRGSAGRVLREGAEGWVESRVSGWVESIEERERGVASVSAPVHGPGGEVVAAVSVSGPIERTTRSPGERYGDAVVAAARRIEARIAA
jgi:DNA-binding IclR family transcriptional regulator